jgi:hypothetical protein
MPLLGADVLEFLLAFSVLRDVLMRYRRIRDAVDNKAIYPRIEPYRLAGWALWQYRWGGGF